jgi:lipopolysaccharide transport system ATP-binding protein
MATPVISVSGLGKRYYLSHQKRTDTLRDSLTQKFRRLVGQAGPDADAEEFWALRDVSFEVNQGDVVGIIGRNGAGKSTLLKILSRITEPTAGTVRLRGRVASLLEVGTGFHPELSGRENIFLNGAILGMSRAEITRKFDEIVAFAEVERFLDTQVKHYSSGMYVRLAFAVAAHLEPEILIVDEVLAVGDVQFQKKCLGKMQDVARDEGRTVLFVSHNLGALQALCQRAIRLEGGRLVGEGPAQEQINLYSRSTRDASAKGAAGRRVGPSLVIEDFQLPRTVASGGGVDFRLVLRSSQALQASDVCLLLHSAMGIRVAIFDLRRAVGPYRLEPDVPLAIAGRLHGLPLVEGDYQIGLYLNTSNFQGDLPDLHTLAVGAPAEPRAVTPYAPHDRGFVELKGEFKTHG